MDNSYIEYNFTISPKEPATEILIAELGNVGFESFIENENGLLAYIQNQDWNEDVLNDIYILSSKAFCIKHSFKLIKQTNWNQEWENNFESIKVDNLVSIRAPFHEKLNLQYEIVIEPKMSFGTGHHETTHMMVQHLLKLNLENKKVLDMGCGTGILAIFAEMKGAKEVDAIDIDNWCFVNSLENVSRNNCTRITVLEGDSRLLINKKYDLIIANINRNILLSDLKIYANCLEDNGVLLLSGFYKEDITIINNEAIKHNIGLESYIDKNNWVALKYNKL